MLIVVEKKGEWVLGRCEETFRRNWWTAQDLKEKGRKIGSSLIFNGMVPDQNLPYWFGDAGPTPYELTILV